MGASGQGAGSPAQGRGDAGRQGGRGGGSGASQRAIWWKDEAIKKEIGLRDDQAKRIDDYFTQRAREIEPLQREYDKQRALLDELTKDRSTDLRTAIRAIELQVALMEVPAVKMNESFFVMLYRMRRVLDAEQDQKLQVALSRRSGRGGGQ